MPARSSFIYMNKICSLPRITRLRRMRNKLLHSSVNMGLITCHISSDQQTNILWAASNWDCGFKHIRFLFLEPYKVHKDSKLSICPFGFPAFFPPLRKALPIRFPYPFPALPGFIYMFLHQVLFLITINQPGSFYIFISSMTVFGEHHKQY